MRFRSQLQLRGLLCVYMQQSQPVWLLLSPRFGGCSCSISARTQAQQRVAMRRRRGAAVASITGRTCRGIRLIRHLPAPVISCRQSHLRLRAGRCGSMLLEPPHACGRARRCGVAWDLKNIFFQNMHTPWYCLAKLTGRKASSLTGRGE